MTKNPRILTLDILRGYFMFVIIVNHIGRFPSVFDLFTGRGELWVSAAEGFFLISGLLVGYVYGPKFLADAKKTARNLWLRAGKIYLWSIFFTLLFTLIGLASGLPQGVKPGLLQTNVANLLYQTLTLKYIYGWADFLPHFVIFLLFAPLALYLIKKRQEWLVLLASLGVWFLRGSFDMAWQFLFISGIVSGYHLPTLENKIARLTTPSRQRLTRIFASIFVFTLVINLFFNTIAHNLSNLSLFSPGLQPVFDEISKLNNSLTPWFDKLSLGPGRLILSMTWFIALYLIVRSQETQINNATRGIFEMFGKAPLFVYGLSATIIYPLQILIVPMSSNLFTNMAIDSVVLITVYFAAKYKSIAVNKASEIILYLKRKLVKVSLEANNE